MTEPRSAGSKAGHFALCVLLWESRSLGTEKTPPEVWISVSPGRSSGQVPFHITLGPPDGRLEPEVWPRLSVVRMGPRPGLVEGAFPGFPRVGGKSGVTQDCLAQNPALPPPGHVASAHHPAASGASVSVSA